MKQRHRGPEAGGEGERRQETYLVGVWLAVLSAFGFSFKAILIKLAYAVPQETPVDAVTLLALRMLCALPVFLWCARSAGRGGKPFSRRDALAIIGLGLVGYYGASIFDFVGLCYISAGLERVILFTYPILTLLFEVLWFRRPVSGYERLAVAVCYAGIALVFVHDLGGAEHQRDIWLGSGFVLASAATYAFYLSGGGRLIARYGSVRFASAALIVSTLATFVHFGVVHSPAALVQPVRVYLLALIMGLFSTVMPVFALAAAISRIGSAPAALIGSLGPVLTIALGWGMLDEPLSLMQIFGALLVIGAVLLIGRKGRQAARKAIPAVVEEAEAAEAEPVGPVSG